jgi:hypothetical protein
MTEGVYVLLTFDSIVIFFSVSDTHFERKLNFHALDV